MKYVAALAAMITASSVAAMSTEHQSAAEIGTTTCATHITRGEADNHNNMAIWMAGYLSAYDLLTHNNFKVIKGTDPGTALIWIAQWCRDNPQRRLNDAAANYVLTLWRK
jgi:hypothetical protein